MSNTSPSVFIVFFDAEPNDTNLANEIQAAIASTAPGSLITIAEVIDYANRAPLSAPLPGITIGILSQAVINNSIFRETLATTVAGSRSYSVRHYFICRGISVEAVSAYPDSAPLFDNAAVVAESELSPLITDLKAFVSEYKSPSQISLMLPGLKLIIGQTTAVALTAVERLQRFMLLAAVAIVILLYLHASPLWVNRLVYVCLFAAGLWLAKVDTIDLFPWLGRQWKFPSYVNDFYSRVLSIGFGPLTYWGLAIGASDYLLTRHRLSAWIFGVAYVLQNLIDLLSVRSLRAGLRAQESAGSSLLTTAGHLDTVCSEARLNAALESCLYQRRVDAIFTLGSIALLLFVALVAAERLPSYNPWLYAVAFLAGLSSTIAKSWGARVSGLEVARYKGLTKDYLAWYEGITEPRKKATENYSSDRSEEERPDNVSEEERLDHFSEEERLKVLRRLQVYRSPQGHAIRRWLTVHDYAFISYAWHDDAETHMSAKLSEAFTQLGVAHFFDRKDVANKFLSWREHVAPALLSCTHIFLIISPAIKYGDAVLREIEATMHRWYLESLPAVICIAEPETAVRLREDPRVSLELRFFLTCCPLMNFEEACDARLLRYMITHTRRQGMLQNWLTVLSGATGLQRLIRMPGIVETEKAP